MPTGTVVAFFGEEAPEGWAVCDGSPMDESNYDRLKQLFKNGGQSTGDLPDFRGRFLRGANGQSKESSAVGALQGDQVGGSFEFSWGTLEVSPGGSHRVLYAVRKGQRDVSVKVDTGMAETRPVNAAVNWLIKL